MCRTGSFSHLGKPICLSLLASMNQTAQSNLGQSVNMKVEAQAGRGTISGYNTKDSESPLIVFMAKIYNNLN